ncbi:hypothetical protein [Kribbella alba]
MTTSVAQRSANSVVTPLAVEQFAAGVQVAEVTGGLLDAPSPLPT